MRTALSGYDSTTLKVLAYVARYDGKAVSVMTICATLNLADIKVRQILCQLEQGNLLFMQSGTGNSCYCHRSGWVINHMALYHPDVLRSVPERIEEINP